MINEKYIRFDWAVKRLLRDKANFGMLEGRAEERLANARSLKSNGVPLEINVKSLGLTAEEIDKLNKI